MRRESTVLLLSSLLPIQAYIASLQNDAILCEDVDLVNAIEFPPIHAKCLQVAFSDENEKVSCILKLLGQNLTPLKSRSLTLLKFRDVRAEAQDNCQTFLLFVATMTDVKQILRSNQNKTKQFFPFSKIYFYTFENFYNPEVDFTEQVRLDLMENALFGYTFKMTEDRTLIWDLLINASKLTISSDTPSDLLHPIVDTRLPKDNFRISLFNCKPSTFYTENASYSSIIDEMDGTEFRFVNEITSNWKKTYNLRDFKRVTPYSPFTIMLEDLSNKTSDLAMCSIFILEKYYKRYDVSAFYDQTCSTFLVPRQEKLNEATAIYTPLELYVWMMFLFYFVLFAFLLNFITKIEKSLMQHNAQYKELSRAILETVAVVSSHSVHRLPNNRQISAHILLTSLILFSMWIDICYTTVYTSRLANPSYEKPINTVNHFLAKDMYICSSYNITGLTDGFRTSINEDYRKLSTRLIVLGDDKSYEERLFAEKKCGVFANRNMDDDFFLTMNSERDDLIGTYRLMDNCVNTHFNGFVFQKYSPYTKLFNWYIPRYREHGIIKKWYLEFSRDQGQYKHRFKDHIRKSSIRPINLMNLSGSFVLLFVGLLLSAISLFAEIMITKC